MSKSRTSAIDDALASMQRLTKSARSGSRKRGSKSRSKPRSGLLTRAAGYVVGVVVAVILPFVTLIKVSTSLYADYGAHHWLALVCGVFASTVILLAYSMYLARRIGMGKYLAAGAGRFIAVLVIAYCAYGLLYLSASNAKSDKVENTYTRLHPLIRLATSTWLLVDRDAVLTDAERTTGDYRSMGLTPLENSLHYEQVDGYAHAVDLRTIGRSPLRNALIKWYFGAMGFKTLRHVGTADHLHVSLPLRSP